MEFVSEIKKKFDSDFFPSEDGEIAKRQLDALVSAILNEYNVASSKNNLSKCRTLEKVMDIALKILHA